MYIEDYPEPAINETMRLKYASNHDYNVLSTCARREHKPLTYMDSDLNHIASSICMT